MQASRREGTPCATHRQEIDSSNEGSADVMELVGRIDASEETKAMLMNDTIFKLFYDKYEKVAPYLA